MNTKINTFLFAGALIAASSANATINLAWGADISQSSNDPATGASATAALNFTEVATGEYKVDVSVTNTTGNSTASSSKLTAVGFDLVDPSTIGTFVEGTYLDTQINNGSINPFGSIEFAAADNSNLLGGNANDALPEGTTDTFSFNLTDTTFANASLLEAAFTTGFTNGSLEFFTRFQQVEPNGRSDKLLGGTVNGGNPVPEPSTYAMFGAAALMLGFVNYRSRSCKS